MLIGMERLQTKKPVTTKNTPHNHFAGPDACSRHKSKMITSVSFLIVHKSSQKLETFKTQIPPVTKPSLLILVSKLPIHITSFIAVFPFFSFFRVL
jgi:hypothetical protein